MPYPVPEPIEQVDRTSGSLRTRPRSKGNYIQHCNRVYAESDGVGLMMDVFQPESGANGCAIVDVVSGAWRSDRVRLNEHLGLGAIDAFCEAGFTVFAVAPGSATVFTAQEMVRNVHAAIRHIRQEASTWAIAPEPLGLCGVSAGGHIAALTALQPQEPNPKGRQAWSRHGTDVAAVGLFFPPTNLLDYGGSRFDFARAGDYAVPRLLFTDGLAGKDDEAIVAAAQAISPVYYVGDGCPPFFVAHATDDSVVPYSQSTRFVDALRNRGGDASLVTHEGPGHPWPTVAETCREMAEWFDARLLS